MNDAIKVLEGKGGELVDDLARRMEQASQELEFEKAARLRDQINGIKADPLDASRSRAMPSRTSMPSRSCLMAAITACPSCSCAAGAISAAATFPEAGHC